jgi:hypothetical protein
MMYQGANMTFRPVISLLFVVSTTLCAANPSQSGKSEALPKYDRATETDFSAVVTTVKEVPRESPLNGINLVVKSASGATFDVYLGPSEFLKSFEVTFVRGDRIHVIGSKVDFSGQPLILVRQVRKESATIYLRDKDGKHYW